MVEDFEPVLTEEERNQLIALDQQYSLFRGTGDRDFYLNTFGDQEKWLRGKVNSSGNYWYFILPNGELREWDGSASATGNLLANLPTSVYDNPLILADAYADGSVLNTADLSNPFQPNGGGPGDLLI